MFNDFYKRSQEGPIFIFSKSTGPANAINFFVELKDGEDMNHSQPLDGEAKIFVRQGKNRVPNMAYEEPLYVKDEHNQPSQLVLPVTNGRSETINLDMSAYINAGYDKFVVRAKDKQNRNSEWWCWIIKNSPELTQTQEKPQPATQQPNVPVAKAIIATTPVAATSSPAPASAKPTGNPPDHEDPSTHEEPAKDHGDSKSSGQEKAQPPSCPDFPVTTPVTCDKRGYFLVTVKSPQTFTVNSTTEMNVMEISGEKIGAGYSVPISPSKNNFKSFLIGFSDHQVIQAMVTFTPEIGEPVSELLCKPAKGGC